MAEENRRVIKSYKYEKWDTSCPVRIEKCDLSFDNKTKHFMIVLKVYNLTDRMISSLYFNLTCSDYNNEVTESETDYAFYKINIMPKSCYYDGQEIVFKSRQTATVDLDLTRVVFEDDSFWKADENAESVIKLSELSLLNSDYPYYSELDDQCYNINFKPTYLFKEINDFWYCSCGQPNFSDKETCIFCGGNKSWQKMHFNEEFLAKEIERKNAFQERLKQAKAAEEEAKKQAEEIEKAEQNNTPSVPPVYEDMTPERDKKKSKRKEKKKDYGDIASGADTDRMFGRKPKSKGKKIGIALLIIAIIAALGVGGYYAYENYIAPLMVYKNAVELMSNKDYDAAADAFFSLGDFKDSKNMHKKAQYEYAGSLASQEKYIEAMEIYTTLEDYEDSSAKFTASKYSYANYLLANGEYDVAIAQFTELGEYEDSAAKITECTYKKGEALLNAGSYDEAITVLDTVKDYGEAANLIKECFYQKAIAFAANSDWNSAIAAMENVGDYKDANVLMETYNSNILDAKYAEKYNQALEFEKAKKWESAYYAYDSIPSTYKDVAARKARLIKKPEKKEEESDSE